MYINCHMSRSTARVLNWSIGDLWVWVHQIQSCWSTEVIGYMLWNCLCTMHDHHTPCLMQVLCSLAQTWSKILAWKEYCIFVSSSIGNTCNSKIFVAMDVLKVRFWNFFLASVRELIAPWEDPNDLKNEHCDWLRLACLWGLQAN